MIAVKTTLEMPDSLFRRAKASAARKGQTMTAFVTAAIEAKLKSDEQSPEERPWMNFAGAFKDSSDESERILQAIAESCERIDPKEWE